jgi:predicted RNA binding protein YcfA (HicA-like mRNA interferase family)
MPRIAPVHWKVLECIFKSDGFKFRGQSGSHRIYEKEEIERPVVILAYNEVDSRIILGLMRTAGMTRDRYFKLLKKCG